MIIFNFKIFVLADWPKVYKSERGPHLEIDDSTYENCIEPFRPESM